MASNTLRTRIQSKIDYFSAWQSSNFIPLLGEICIAIIPRNVNATSDQDIGVGVDTTTIGVKGTESGPRASVGLTPYAIGMKVGDGANTFANLPWIQGIAGDVYAWAKKEVPEASDVKVTYNNNANSTVQTAISGIEASLGNIVSSGVDPATLGNALAQLQDQLGGQESEVFNSNPLSDDDPPAPTYPTEIIRTLTQDGLTITATSSPMTVDDLPSIPLTKITGINYPTGYDYNSSTNPIATKTYVDNLTAGLTGAMHFKGELESLPSATDTTTFNTYESGDVILVGDKEYVYNKTSVAATSEWIELGDESSYAIKGSITYNDLSSALQNTLDSKLDDSDGKITKLDGIAAGAQVNVIESVQVNGTTLPISNKTVDISVPTGTLASLNEVAESNLASALATKINGKANTSDLHDIAFSGDIDDLDQTSVVVFDCGNATNKLYSIS